MHVHVHVYTFPFRSSTAETTDKLIAINSVVPCPLRHDSPMYSPSKLKFLYLSSRHILYPLHLLHASAIIYTLLVFGLFVDFSFFDSVHDQFAVPTYVSFFFLSFFLSWKMNRTRLLVFTVSIPSCRFSPMCIVTVIW